MSQQCLSDEQRAQLKRAIAAETSNRQLASRAKIALLVGDHGVAHASRAAGVSYHTASKWAARFRDEGLEGLVDKPRSGRPRTDDNAVEKLLSAALTEPPGGGVWTSRTVAAATGMSQSTVSRLERSLFPHTKRPIARALNDHGLLLAFVYIGADLRALGFYPPVTQVSHRAQPASSVTRELADPLRTILCAGVAADRGGRAPRRESTTALLGRLMSKLPADRTTTVLADAPLEPSAQRWVRDKSRMRIVTATRSVWLAQLQELSLAVDSRQSRELVEVQRQVRRWAAVPGQEPFEWVRSERIFGSLMFPLSPAAHTTTHRMDIAPVLVMGALVAGLADGSIHAGRRVSERNIAQRLSLSRGAVADSLLHLVGDGLLGEDAAGHAVVTIPTKRDVLETYTARGLLGTALIRRVAARSDPLPNTIAETLELLQTHARAGNVMTAGLVDLDLQDMLAQVADMPRIAAMFVRLTWQLRIFVAVLGLDYSYPADEIIADDHRLLAALQTRDVDGAVTIWRQKLDRAAQYMNEHVPTG